MAPGRTTRSTNKALPRKQYTDTVDIAYIGSNAQSASNSSNDNDSDESIAAARGPSTAKPSSTSKRKRPAKQAAQISEDVATTSPAKKQRTRAQKSRARNETPQLLWSALGLDDSPDPELPELPASTYAPSAIGEWVGFSDDIMRGQTEGSEAGDKAGGSSKPTEGHKSPAWSNSSTVEMLKATLAARQGLGGMDHAQLTRLGRNLSRRSRSGSIEWVELGNNIPETMQEEPPALEQLRAQSADHSLSSERVVQLAMEAMTDGDQTPRDKGVESWVNNKGDSDADDEEVDEDGLPIVAVRSDSDEDGDEHAGDEEANGVRPPQAEEQDGNSEVNGFDLDFEDDGTVKDMYDVGDLSQGEGDAHPQRDEESLFIQDEEGSVNADHEPQSADSGDDADHHDSEAELQERDEDGHQLSGMDDNGDEHDTGEGSQRGPSQIPVAQRTCDLPEAGQQRLPETPSSPRESSAQSSRFRPSAYIEATENSYLAVVKSRDLESLLRCMRTRTWTDEGSQWESELLSGHNVHVSVLELREINTERKKTNRPPLSDRNNPSAKWYNAHRGEVKTIKAREILQHVYHAWRTCRYAPSAAKTQADYFTNGEGKGFRKTLSSCNNYVEYICRRLPNDRPDKVAWAKSMTQSLSQRIVPLIVILLKEAFLLADTRPRRRNIELGHVQGLPRMVDATDFHLQNLLLILGWLKRLCSALISEFEHSAPDPRPADWQTRMKQRWNVMQPLHRFEEALKRGVENLAEAADAPSRKAQAAENDRRMRELKEAKEQQDCEARAHQLQLFYASLQCAPSQTQSRITSSAATYSSRQAQHQQPKREKLSDQEEYIARNGGWAWDEDNTLMNALKRVDKPSASGLADLLPGRDADQVKSRLMELREIGRKHYEKKGMAIPRWCQGYGWR